MELSWDQSNLGYCSNTQYLRTSRQTHCITTAPCGPLTQQHTAHLGCAGRGWQGPDAGLGSLRPGAAQDWLREESLGQWVEHVAVSC